MFEIWGIKFHAYGLLIGLGVWVAMEIASRKKIAERAMVWTVFAGVVGARIYHVVDYWSRYYSNNLLKILYVWEGGMGIWGAIAGGLLGLFIYCYFNKLKYLATLDGLIVGVPLAQAIGRVGNFVNGELLGKNGEPLFAYEGALDLLLFGVLWKVSHQKTKPGLVTGLYLVGYGMIRILLENLRPTENIWKFVNVPVAMIFGMISIITGIWIATVRVRNSQ